MRLRALVSTVTLVTCCLSTAAMAQDRQPRGGAFAVGGDVGFIVPDEPLHVGFTPAVYGEFYLMPRVSVRIREGWSRNEFKNHTDRDLEQFSTALSVIYNWEADEWHPFALIGGSVHAVRAREDSVENPRYATRGGLNIGAGVEYFSRRKVSIKFEGTYYFVEHRDLPSEAWGFVLSAGLKKYW